MGPWGWLVPVVIGVCTGFRGRWGLCWDVCATSQRGLCGGRWSRGHRGLHRGIALSTGFVPGKQVWGFVGAGLGLMGSVLDLGLSDS